jgi:hypothetical protein
MASPIEAYGLRLVCGQVAVFLGEAGSLNGGTRMRNLAVNGSITVDGIINASEGWFIPSGEQDADQSNVYEVLAP